MTTTERAARLAEALASLPSQRLTHVEECFRCRALVEEGEARNLHPTDVVLPLATHLVRVPGALSSAFEARALRFSDLVDALWSQFPAWPRSILPGADVSRVWPAPSEPALSFPAARWLPRLPDRSVPRPCSAAFWEAEPFRFPQLPESRWSRFPEWGRSQSSPPPVVQVPPTWPGYAWFDVALWFRWPPSLMAGCSALVEAPSAFAAVEVLMRYAWRWSVPRASARLLGGPLLRYWAVHPWIALFRPDDLLEEGTS